MAVDRSEVILDKEIFEVLSSDKRIDILKSLNTRRKTNSELAREFSLQESTMHHHLTHLYCSICRVLYIYLNSKIMFKTLRPGHIGEPDEASGDQSFSFSLCDLPYHCNCPDDCTGILFPQKEELHLKFMIIFAFHRIFLIVLY